MIRNLLSPLHSGKSDGLGAAPSAIADGRYVTAALGNAVFQPPPGLAQVLPRQTRTEAPVVLSRHVEHKARSQQALALYVAEPTSLRATTQCLVSRRTGSSCRWWRPLHRRGSLCSRGSGAAGQGR